MSLLNARNITDRDDAVPDLTIQRIEIRNLFGLYSYDLMLGADRFVSHPNLMILYGDNGSGKTTILKLIFNLLSPEENAGHRTYLVRTPFESFRVTLSDSTILEAVRSSGLTGPYQYNILRGSERVASHQFTPSPPNERIRRSEQRNQASYAKLMTFLQELSIKFHYLGDDRKIAIDYEPSKMARRRRLYRERAVRVMPDGEYYLEHDDLDDPDSNLQQAVARAEEYVRREAFARSR